MSEIYDLNVGHSRKLTTADLSGSGGGGGSGTTSASDLVADSAGTLFSPGSCSYTRTYDGSGNLLTEVATLAGVVRIKTYTWTSGNLTTETQWVVQ